MILRYNPNAHALSYFLLLLSLAAVRVSADEPFDCHVTIGEYSYDLTGLDGAQEITRSRDSPPTKYTDTVTFNLCGEIPRSSAPESEQCPSGSKACLTKTNVKEGDSDRITEVVQLATDSSDEASYETLSAPNKGILLSFKGPSYPDPVTGEPKPQSFNIRVLCDTESSDPAFVSYDGSAVWVEWHAKAGCAMGPGAPPVMTPDPGDDDGKKESSMGSGLGYFFLLLLVALLAYFGLGAYYNYSTYGATGFDLIPYVSVHVRRLTANLASSADTVTSGEKFPTCCVMLFHIYVQASARGTRQVEEVILPYDA
ncbi:hypothetical protein NM688_g5774 [Phlebia brevispora]|uniref:Uncharacterized protein n=1 Tax=Phlebia brevispora TaxID=194682 RepID=A0ACC1SPT8_9APHY|nr:hypothetical protein NM688_g5774 [Phlebia brevispora]